MMRYSEISRDLSSDSLRYVELGKQQQQQQQQQQHQQPQQQVQQRKQREMTPSSDISTCSGPLLSKSQHDFYETDYYRAKCTAMDKRNLANQRSLKRNTNAAVAGNNSNSNNNNNNNSNSSNNKINGNALTAGYLRPRKDSTQSTKSCQIDIEHTRQVAATKALNLKGSRRKNSIGCLKTLSSSPDSPGCYYSIGSSAIPPGKTQSLPAHSSIKHIDPVIVSALRMPADELANQITLLDFPIFAAIHPDELSSCAWTKKDKHIVTPNIVAFTKRFNHTSFWTVQEILSCEQPKQRAEILSHFIKVAKKLHELNNLHSLFAIISAMQSASIYRLKKTWACLTKKERQAFDRLSDIFSDQNNWEKLRMYYKSLRLPCIPYLGLFLTDIIYIDLKHPHKGGLEPEPRRDKMNNILRVISNYQQSNYTHIQPIEATQKYLTSIRYIEELQNIFEEDQYKLSLHLEPASPSGPSSSSCSSKESFNVEFVSPAMACLNISPAKTIGSMRMASGTKFVPGHRKCRSLGTNIFGKIVHTANNHAGDVIGTGHHLADADQRILSQQPRHPLDDSVLEHSNPLTAADLTSLESADGTLCDFSGSDVDLMAPEAVAAMQGCVRRKTVQKEGRKPAVASWQRYWLHIMANSLVYFPPKSFKGCERSDFKREPCKVCPLEGWYAQISDNTKHKNTFELYHRTMGTIYKFRTDSPQATHLWTNAICKLAASRVPKPLPINLMSFE